MIHKGEILGGMYRIDKEIGQGGAGIIYLADHLRLQKKVVVKKIKDNFIGQVDGRAEVDILKRLHHGYLPQVYDFLVWNSSVYTVMEYVEGRDLQKYLDAGHRFSEQTLRKWLTQLTSVLVYLHGQTPPVLHSDIKPSNLMITPDEDIYLIDFNISLDGSHAGGIKGLSRYYAAPEQYEKAQSVLYGRRDAIVLDGRMDIYSLGATFFYAMTGMLPSPEEEPICDITRMDLPYSDGLKAVVSKAMRRRPSARFKSAQQMHKMLEQIERMDPQYKTYGVLQIAGVFAWLLCVMIGGLCLYYGSWQNAAEKWQAAYSELYLSAENGLDEETITAASAMVKDFQYRSYLKRSPQQYADVLQIMGEAYFHKGMYGEAADCYRQAWELMPEEGSYCKDYVISLARDGKVATASRVMDSAEHLRGLSHEERQLMQAELAWMDGDSVEAVALLEQMMAASALRDPEAYAEACMLQADIHIAQEGYEQAVAILETAQEKLPSEDILRQLGQTAVSAASAGGSAEGVYLQKAYRCYQTLEEMGQMGFTDCLNLALVERALGQYEASNRTLRRLRSEYPDDYRMDMWMCYNYLSMMETGAAFDTYEEAMDEFQFLYKRCRSDYDASGENDPDMERLMEIAGELEVR